jgi:hypothetical protein
MAFGATDIPNRSAVDVRREAVAFHESKLAAAKMQRDTILIDKRVAEARADKGMAKIGAAGMARAGQAADRSPHPGRSAAAINFSSLSEGLRVL